MPLRFLPANLLPSQRPLAPGRIAPFCSVALVLSLPLASGHLPGAGRLQPPGWGPGLGQRNAAVAATGPGGRAIAQEAQAAKAALANLYTITPERRALLNTIRYAEGTWLGGSRDGYRVLFGGAHFVDLARHPQLIVTNGYSSAAAGAYQFLPGTWNEAARRLRLNDFRPANQDQAALYLVEKRGALARFDRHGLSHDVLAQLAKEWASLPTLQGGSYYGQPVKDGNDLLRFFNAELSRQRAQPTG